LPILYVERPRPVDSVNFFLLDSRLAVIAFAESEPTSKDSLRAGMGLDFSRVTKSLRGAYFLGKEEVAPASITLMSRAECLIEWLKNSFFLDGEDCAATARHFESIFTLVSGMGGFKLNYPHRFEALAMIRQAIADHADP
jgi:hypothetical protein